MENRIISADDHVQEPQDTWQSRVPARFRQRAPKVVHLPEGDAWEIDGKVGATIGLEAQAGKKFEDYRPCGERFDTIPKGSFDPIERLKDMDLDGVYAQVLYSNTATFRLLEIPDIELQAACVRAYNDFLSEFCSANLDRFIGIAIVCADEVSEAVREVQRVARLPGIKGIIVPLYPRLMPLNSDLYDPLWAGAQDTTLPVHVHQGTGDSRFKKRPDEAVDPHLHGDYFINMCDAAMGNFSAMSKMIFGGALQRFPKLRFVSVEGQIGWIPFFLERADRYYERHRFWTKLGLDEQPSAYFHRQCAATFILDRAGLEMRDQIGVDNLLWSSDYPHTDSTWPKSRQYIEETFKGVSLNERQKITGGNAARLYKLA